MNDMTRYTIRARPQGVLYKQRAAARLERDDEAVEVDARGSNPLDAVKALIKATGLNPHMSVCGWPFRLGDPDGANAEGGAA